ncbi:MAG: APC family permease [Thaumarchaeota archaeon]|nr:APC family permease [Nitrososphaerota archaeon]
MAQPTSFAREATGIVRSISPLQAFITTVAVTNIGFGVATTYLPMLAVFPGTNIPVIFVLVLPFLLVTSALYSLLSLSMPRSGGDYVWTGRILHPSMGSSLAFTNVIFNSIFLGFFANTFVTYGLYSLFDTIGAVTNNQGLISWSTAVFTNLFWVTLIGTILIVYMALTMISGTLSYLKHQIVYWVIGMIGTLTAMAYLFSSNPTSFAATFDKLLGHYTTYQGIITTAHVSYTPGTIAFGALALAWLANNGYQYSGYFSGEVKQIRKSMFISMMGDNLVATAIYSLFALALIGAVGEKWLNSVASLSVISASAWGIPVPPNPYFFASLLANNVIIATVINVGLIAWAIIIIPSNWMATTRIILAMGFDRILPSRFADVSDRYHTPVKAIAFVAFITWLGLLATNYYGAVSANLNYTVVYTFILAIVSIAGSIFPFVRKSIYQQSPIAQYRPAGIPLVTIVGIISFLFFAFLSYTAAANSSIGGPNGFYSLVLAVAAFVGSGAIYFISREYHLRRSHVDIGMNFKEIPPE